MGKVSEQEAEIKELLSFPEKKGFPFWKAFTHTPSPPLTLLPLEPGCCLVIKLPFLLSLSWWSASPGFRQSGRSRLCVPSAKPNPEITHTLQSAQELCSGNAVFNAVSEFEE